MDLGNEDQCSGTANYDSHVCLTKYLGAESLAKILSYLWFDDHSIIATVCLALHDVIQSESLATYMLQRLLEYLNQPLRSSTISFNAEVRLVLRRVSSWPAGVDAAALNHSQGPRNVSIVLSDHHLGNDSRIVYHEKRKEFRSKAYAVAISDDHFPCLPSSNTYRFKNDVNQNWIRPMRDISSSNKVEPPNIIIRSMTPFTKVVQINEAEQVVTLSCVAYFESQVQPKAVTSSMDTTINDDNDSHQLYQLQLSIGLACALFPLRGRRAGFDKNSFGYHGDGRIYHGGRNCIKVGPSYDIGDTVGCGVLYPPLGKQHGQIFFTKNGVLAAVLDIGTGGLLSLPWFPVVGLAPYIPTEFNFGILRSFAFDVIAFEEQQLVEVLGVNFPPAAGFSASANFIRESDLNGNNNSSSNSNNSNIPDSSSNIYNNSDKKSDSSLVSFPYSMNGHPDPWRYYESLAEEQEAKQRIPRHPKYRNSRWEASSRSTDPAVVSGVDRAGTGTGAGTLSLSQPLNVTGAVTLGHRAPMPVPERKSLDDSLSSTPTSSSSSIVRNSIIYPHTHTETLASRDDNMSVSPPGEGGFLDPDSAVSPVNVRVPMMATVRTGRGGRERGRGGDFLLAKRQYAYISRSAKLERLTTIIRATNTPHGQCAPPFSSSTRRCLMGAFGSNNTTTNTTTSTVHENEDVNEKKRVSVRREKTLLEKGKRKRKSLFLNPDLRAATLSEISSTSRPAMGGSDASCEDEDEEDSEEEEDDEEELASTCGQDAESHDEWGFRGFRANRPLLPPRVMIHAPTSYSVDDRGLDDDDDLGSMAVEPSSEDEDEDEKLDVNVSFAVAPRPSSSPLAMRPPSLPEGSRARKQKTMTYQTYNSFESGTSSYQGQSSVQALQLKGPDKDRMGLEDTSMGVFVALADVAHGSGPDWLRRGSVSSSSRAFGSRAERNGDSDDSVATSLFVEVASVDECGSYIGYGGAGESEEEDDEVASERGSRNGTLSHSLSGHPVSWVTGAVDPDADLESLSVEDKFGLKGGRKRKGFPSDGSSGDFGHFQSHSSNNLRVMWDPDGDGYDGASERGRCETDGFEDFNTDGDVEFEEIEEREDRYSNSSGSGYDGSVDADGGASDTYATERNTVVRHTLLPTAASLRVGSPSMHSQDSSVSGGGRGAGGLSAPAPSHSNSYPTPIAQQRQISGAMDTGGSKRPKRRKLNHQLSRRDFGSKDNTDDQLHRR